MKEGYLYDLEICKIRVKPLKVKIIDIHFSSALNGHGELSLRESHVESS